MLNPNKKGVIDIHVQNKPVQNKPVLFWVIDQIGPLIGMKYEEIKLGL